LYTRGDVADPLSVEGTRAGGSRSRRARLRGAPVLIEVRDLEKTFLIPDRRVDTLKERVVHPLRKVEFAALPSAGRVRA
jgi:hypothetical protein